jgi:hypothetical protein
MHQNLRSHSEPLQSRQWGVRFFKDEVALELAPCHFPLKTFTLHNWECAVDHRSTLKAPPRPHRPLCYVCSTYPPGLIQSLGMGFLYHRIIHNEIALPQPKRVGATPNPGVFAQTSHR